MKKVDVAVVGAGPAGMSAAISAVKAGCSVLLVDEALREGGQIYRQPASGSSTEEFGTRAENARKAVLLNEFAEVSSMIECRFGTVAHSLYPDGEIQVSDGQTSARVQAGAVILATGVSERAVPLPGWTLPGVTYAGAMQALLKAHGVVPGKKVFIAGVGALPLVVGAQLAREGVGVQGVALMHPLSAMAADPYGLVSGWRLVKEGFEYRRWLKSCGAPVLGGWAPLRMDGEERVQSITVAPVSKDGSFRIERARSFEVDAVGLNFGFTSNSELARMAGVHCTYDPIRGGWLPVRDTVGRTNIERLFVAGDGAELRGALVAAAEGRIVGAAAAAFVRGHKIEQLPAFERARRQNERFQRALRLTLGLPAGVWDWAEPETVVCRCEGVTKARVCRAVADGHLTLDGIKRNTRAGMGWCGGKTCLQAVYCYGKSTNQTMNDGPMRARPVARPVRLGALATQETCD